MSRSHHITKREAAERFSQGDIDAAVEYSQKRNLKRSHTKFREIYASIKPSQKTPELRNSVTASSVKAAMKSTKEAFLKKVD